MNECCFMRPCELLFCQSGWLENEFQQACLAKFLPSVREDLETGKFGTWFQVWDPPPCPLPACQLWNLTHVWRVSSIHMVMVTRHVHLQIHYPCGRNMALVAVVGGWLGQSTDVWPHFGASLLGVTWKEGPWQSVEQFWERRTNTPAVQIILIRWVTTFFFRVPCLAFHCVPLRPSLCCFMLLYAAQGALICQKQVFIDALLQNVISAHCFMPYLTYSSNSCVLQSIDISLNSSRCLIRHTTASNFVLSQISHNSRSLSGESSIWSTPWWKRLHLPENKSVATFRPSYNWTISRILTWIETTLLFKRKVECKLEAHKIYLGMKGGAVSSNLRSFFCCCRKLLFCLFSQRSFNPPQAPLGTLQWR